MKLKRQGTGRSNQRLSLTALALPALVLLALAAAAAAEDPDETRRHGIFLDTLDVSLVNVEIVAIRDGRPVTDLTREDFEVFDDGRPVEITNFFRVDGGRRALPPGEEDGAEDVAAEPSPLERAFIVVLVDQSFISPPSRARVFSELRDKLDELMSDGAQVLVVSKHRDVELVQRPTTDRLEIERALDRLSKMATSNYGSEVRRTISEIEQGLNLVQIESFISGFGTDAAAEGDAQHTFNLARSHSLAVYQEVRQSLGVLRGFLGSLAGLSGRKAVLYVCDRLPVRPGELVWNAWIRKYGNDYGSQLGVHSLDSAVREFDTSPLLRNLIADAAASRIAFYPVGAGPVSGFDALAAENRSTAITGADLTELSDVESGLRMLADGTGGQAAFGSSSPGWLFDRLRQDLTHYYSLAYPSPHRGDGEKHAIEVLTKRPDVKLHYLERYTDKSGAQEMNERTLASLYLESGDNPLEVRVTRGEAERQKDGDYVMDLQVHFPIANLVLLPQEKTHVGKVSIVFLVRDAKGRLSDPVEVRMPIEIPHESMLQALTQTAVYSARLVLKGGEQRIAVGVHDDLGQASSTVNVDVRLGGSRG